MFKSGPIVISDGSPRSEDRLHVADVQDDDAATTATTGASDVATARTSGQTSRKEGRIGGTK